MKTRSRTVIITGVLTACACFGQPDHHAPAKSAAKPPAEPKHTEAKPAETKHGESKPVAKAPASVPVKGATKAEGAGTGTGELHAPTKVTEPEVLTAEQALERLREGNARWVKDTEEHPSSDAARRQLTAQGQHPFATIITCADSRLPVERIFDRGVGELFVVRVAGNVAGTSETGTAEYAVEHLKTPVIVVMGHTKCGAVAAAASGAELHGSLGELVARITPAVERARKVTTEGDAAALASASVRENVWQTVFDLLSQSAEVRSGVREGHVQIVGAVCDITTGKVEFMGEHPWQREIIAAIANAAPVSHAEVEETP